MIEKLFKLKENKTDVKTEVIGGITTFMTMAYILAVNPTLLSAAGMDATAVLMATCLASFIGTAVMALMANYPFALAPGMGLNAYFAFTVCGTYGYDWRVALLAVFVEGIIFIILSLTNVREAIFNAIPSGLKKGVSAGIGLFIAFVGLQGAHVIVNSDSTLTTYVSFAAEFHTLGICALLADSGALYVECEGFDLDWHRCDMDSRHDLSGAGNLYRRCREWFLFSVSDICHHGFYGIVRDLWTVFRGRFLQRKYPELYCCAVCVSVCGRV